MSTTTPADATTPGVNTASPLIFLIPIIALFQSFVPVFIKKLTSLCVSVSPLELRLVDEIKDLKEQQSNISMMDEFAKHAKLERRILKLREDLKQCGSSRISERDRTSRAFTITIYSLLGLFCLFLVLSYGGEPLLLLPPDWLFPLGWLLSLPSGVSGAIGLPIWTFVSRSVVKSVLQKS